MTGYNDEYVKYLDEVIKKLTEPEERLKEPAPKPLQSDKDLEEKNSSRKRG